MVSRSSAFRPSNDLLHHGRSECLPTLGVRQKESLLVQLTCFAVCNCCEAIIPAGRVQCAGSDHAAITQVEGWRNSMGTIPL